MLEYHALPLSRGYLLYQIVCGCDSPCLFASKCAGSLLVGEAHALGSTRRMPGLRPKRKRSEVQEEEGSSNSPLTKAAKACGDGGDEAAAGEDCRDLAFDVDVDVDEDSDEAEDVDDVVSVVVVVVASNLAVSTPSTETVVEVAITYVWFTRRSGTPLTL